MPTGEAAVKLPNWVVYMPRACTRSSGETIALIEGFIREHPQLGKDHIGRVCSTSLPQLFEMTASDSAAWRLAVESWIWKVKPTDEEMVKATIELTDRDMNQTWVAHAWHHLDEFLFKTDVKYMRCYKNGLIGIRASRRAIKFLRGFSYVSKITVG